MSAMAPEAVLNVRHVTVSIDPNTGQPVCTPDTTPVNLANVLIYASLDTNAVTAGFTFPDNNAIAINNPPNPDPNFPYPSWTIKNGGGKKVNAALFDALASTGSFNYTVSVVSPTGQRLRVDPVIQNGETGGGGGG
jgi:hypothetical protein